MANYQPYIRLIIIDDRADEAQAQQEAAILRRFSSTLSF